MNSKVIKQQNKINQMRARFFAGFSCAAYGCGVLAAIISSKLPENSAWKEAFGSIIEIGFLAGMILTLIWSICKPGGYPFSDEGWNSLTQEDLEELEKLAQRAIADLK